MIEKDVVVVGSGGSGLVAAITAARSGLSVLVVEKAPYFGGTTALSGGGIWIPGNSVAKAAGYDDSTAEVKTYVGHLVGQNLREEMLDAYLENAPRMVDFITENTPLTFRLGLGQPDWGAGLPGAHMDGRLMGPEAFDGRTLGPYFSQLRPAREEFNAPAGFMVDITDLPHIANVTSSFASFSHMTKLVFRFLFDRLRYPRGTRLTMGNALAGGLLRGALDAGIELWREAAVVELKQADGRVTGVSVKKDGQTVEVIARRGVVLATGGFSANAELRRKYLPMPDQHVSITSEGATGDGIALAQGLGARLDDANHHNAAWAIVSTYTKPDGSTAKYAHLLEMSKPGCIAVNAKGERFFNEASLDFVNAMNETGAERVYIVCDAAFIKKYGFGMVYAGAPNLKALLANGYVTEAPTLAALAAAIEVDPAGLEATVAKVNADAATGVDTVFHKGESVVELAVGDPTHKLNPCFGAVGAGPYYAIRIYPGNGSTSLGLYVDDGARVLDGDNRPIPGLYAAGLDMNSIWRGRPPGNGANNGPAMTFGYIAAKSLIADA